MLVPISPMEHFTSPFIFAVCQSGAEKVLKQELEKEHPQLKFAFSRPGFVTFKSETPLPDDFELRSIFARAYGLSVGKMGTVGEVAPLVDQILSLFPQAKVPYVLHVFEREEEKTAQKWDRESVLKPLLSEMIQRECVSRCNGQYWSSTEEPALNQGVVDVLILEPERGEKSPLWLGFHRHGRGHVPWAGGRPTLVCPPEVPSRAYLKLEEAVRWGDVPLREGDVAVEVGSAPGGASLALLQRGLKVYGVDPALMAQVVRRHPNFVGVRKSVAHLESQDLPPLVHWVLFDINAGAEVSVPEAERMVERYSESLLGLFLTLKLNNWRKVAGIPVVLERVRGLGFSRVKAVQLFHNRQEILVLGLTRRAMLRNQHIGKGSNH